MLSWTVLTPCYEEDVLYPLHSGRVAQALGCKTTTSLQDAMAAATPAPAGGSAPAPSTNGLTDLLTEVRARRTCRLCTLVRKQAHDADTCVAASSRGARRRRTA